MHQMTVIEAVSVYAKLLSHSVLLQVFDTTLRDGEQSPGCSMTSEEKLQVCCLMCAMLDINESFACLFLLVLDVKG